MLHNLNIPDHCQTLWDECKTLIPLILENCPIKTSDLKITHNTSINAEVESIYLIKNGTISELYQEQVVVHHEEGDLIIADDRLATKSTNYENDFAVVVDEYDANHVLDAIFNDKSKFLLWNQYISTLTQSYQLLMLHFSQQEVAFRPEFRYHPEGEVIIEENTEGDEVFTLLTGEATVTIDKTQVGTIKKDEIFGAIAALTNTKRSASVIAITECETIVVKSNRFRDLLAARPDTVQKLINDMARTIVSCNERIMNLTKE